MIWKISWSVYSRVHYHRWFWNWFFACSSSNVRLEGLEASLSLLQKEHPDITQHVHSEANIRERLIHVERELDRYRATYGESSIAFPPDAGELSHRLRQKDGELRELRLQLSQRDEVCSAVFLAIWKHWQPAIEWEIPVCRNGQTICSLGAAWPSGQKQGLWLERDGGAPYQSNSRCMHFWHFLAT